MEKEKIMDEMRAKWKELLKPFSVDQELEEAMFADLVAHYENDGRHYHDLKHIHNLLEAIDDMSAQADDLTAIQLAAWYHDVIYEIFASDNEAKSAVYAGRVLKKAGFPEEIVNTVMRMIEATEISKDPPDHVDFKILLDADLATLASDHEYYDENTRAIRKEFSFVPDEEYLPARKKLLKKFLRRDRIFLTEKMYKEFEEKARQNILREISTLPD